MCTYFDDVHDVSARKVLVEFHPEIDDVYGQPAEREEQDDDCDHEGDLLPLLETQVYVTTRDRHSGTL